MKEMWERFGSRPFTFEEFVNDCVKPEDVNQDQTPEMVAEASLIFLLHEGYLIKSNVGDKIWYIRTGKKIPPPKKS